ncbi:hypothetical protein KUCAC02_032859, partial [Chaenocephalus aceratus]
TLCACAFYPVVQNREGKRKPLVLVSPSSLILSPVTLQLETSNRMSLDRRVTRRQRFKPRVRQRHRLEVFERESDDSPETKVPDSDPEHNKKATGSQPTLALSTRFGA